MEQGPGVLCGHPGVPIVPPPVSAQSGDKRTHGGEDRGAPGAGDSWAAGAVGLQADISS